MSLIKICGLRRLEDIEYVNELKPDFIGFVFADSKRKVTVEQAKELRQMLDPGIKAVGVFVNADRSDIEQIVNERIIDIVQLHGDENEDYVSQIRKSVKCPIIRAVRVRDFRDIEKCGEMECDYILLDAWDRKHYGGLGKKFDWSVIGKINKPFFLAGGLDQNNIAEAVKIVNPFSIDISSGVETDGFKDRDKIEKVINIVRSV